MNFIPNLYTHNESAQTVADDVIIRWLGLQPYDRTWKAMQHFTDHRTEQTLDEIWLLEHEPVFTQGQNGKAEHILNAGKIPIVYTDRGGQVTYHGPGQLMVYTLVDLRRKKTTVREFVSFLENAVIDYLNDYKIVAHAKLKAPGVYLEDSTGLQKICSIGLRIRRGCSYHGIAFNIDMDLSPFERINPCGFARLKMTQLSAYVGPQLVDRVARKLAHHLTRHLRYNHPKFDNQ